MGVANGTSDVYSDIEEEARQLRRQASHTSPRGAPYSLVEELATISYILDGNYESLVGGNKVWMRMEDAYICGTRTWSSLKNRYRKNILTNLKR